MGLSLSKVKVVWFDVNVFNKENELYFEEIKIGMDDIIQFNNL